MLCINPYHIFDRKLTFGNKPLTIVKLHYTRNNPYTEQPSIENHSEEYIVDRYGLKRTSKIQSTGSEIPAILGSSEQQTSFFENINTEIDNTPTIIEIKNDLGIWCFILCKVYR